AIHPLHDLFTHVDAAWAADGTTLQRELRCNYCAKTWPLHKYSTGKRAGKWRAVSFDRQRDHMLQECNHGSDDIPSVASAAKKDVHACVASIRAQNRRWPPSRGQLTELDQVAAVASQSLALQRSSMPRSVSMLQPNQHVDSGADDMDVSPRKKHCTNDR